MGGTEYYLVLYATLTGGKQVTLAQTKLFIELDNVPNEDVLPVQAGNLVPNVAVYDGSGHYVIAGLTAGKAPRPLFHCLMSVTATARRKSSAAGCRKNWRSSWKGAAIPSSVST